MTWPSIQITSALALGAKGVISVLSNIIPADTHRICSSYFEGRREESDDLQLKYLELIEALFLDVNPIPVKQAMRAMGYDANDEFKGEGWETLQWRKKCTRPSTGTAFWKAMEKGPAPSRFSRRKMPAPSP